MMSENQYRAGMLRAAKIAKAKRSEFAAHDSKSDGVWIGRDWASDIIMQAILAEAEAEADVQAPQPNAVPEPVVWQIKTKKSGWWSNTDALTFKTCSERPDVWDVRPLYATPPASVPAGEVTEAVASNFVERHCAKMTWQWEVVSDRWQSSDNIGLAIHGAKYHGTGRLQGHFPGYATQPRTDAVEVTETAEVAFMRNALEQLGNPATIIDHAYRGHPPMLAGVNVREALRAALAVRKV